MLIKVAICGSVVGSVGIYGPSARIDEPKMLEYSKLARKAGEEISVVLGFQEGELQRPGMGQLTPRFRR